MRSNRATRTARRSVIPLSLTRLLQHLFLAPDSENGFGIAVRLLAAFGYQVASGVECDATVQIGAHRLVSRVAVILLVHDLRHALQGHHHLAPTASPVTQPVGHVLAGN